MRGLMLMSDRNANNYRIPAVTFSPKRNRNCQNADRCQHKAPRFPETTQTFSRRHAGCLNYPSGVFQDFQQLESIRNVSGNAESFTRFLVFSFIKRFLTFHGFV